MAWVMVDATDADSVAVEQNINRKEIVNVVAICGSVGNRKRDRTFIKKVQRVLLSL